MKRTCVVLIASTLFAPAMAQAQAVFCVRSGATGSGSHWADALPALPQTLQRGATYFVADGMYGNHVFEDPADGTKRITIQKATSTEHGPATGWQDTYGDGQAVFTGANNVWAILTGHYTFEGQTGSGKTGYGFRLAVTEGFRSQVISIGDENHPIVSGITLSHLDASAPGQAADGTVTCDNNNNDDPGCPINDIILGQGLTDSVIADNYLHGSSWHANVRTQSWRNVVIERNYFHNSNRKEGIMSWDSTGVTVRNNLWENAAGTGIIAFAASSDWRIYNNVFFTTNPTYTTSDCVICVVSGHGYVTSNMKVFSNTFVNLQSVADLHFDVGTGNETYNNLFYGPNGIGLGGPAMAHDNNWCFDPTGAAGCSAVDAEPSGLVGAGDPFVNSAAHDFRLKQPLPGGKVLVSPYDRDFSGTVRSRWDFGAFEFVAGSTSPRQLTAPRNLRVK